MSCDRRRLLQSATVALLPAWPQRRARGNQIPWPEPGDVLVHDAGADQGEPVRPAGLQIGAAPLIAVARAPDGTVKNGSRLQRVVLVRIDPARLDAKTRAAAAEGIIGYAQVCPHQGCDVTGWNAERAELSCPCHFSRFNAAKGGTVIDGPAPRRLSQLPLKLDGDSIVVAAPFSKKPGYKKAGRT